VRLIRHLVLFPIRPEVPEERVDEAVTRLRGLAAVAGVHELRVERSTDVRKGRVLVENALIDAEKFEAFRASTEHRDAAEFLAGIAQTWLIGDYDE
jgi:hypothetical protein